MCSYGQIFVVLKQLLDLSNASTVSDSDDDQRVRLYLSWVRPDASEIALDPSCNIVSTAMAQPMTSPVRLECLYLLARTKRGMRGNTMTAVAAAGATDAHATAASPDSGLLASGSDDETVSIWKVSSGACVATHTARTIAVNATCYSPCRKLLASRHQMIKLCVCGTSPHLR